MNNNLHQYAYAAGIRFDSFGSPVVDKTEMLQDYVQNFFTQLVDSLPPHEASKLRIEAVKYGLK